MDLTPARWAEGQRQRDEALTSRMEAFLRGRRDPDQPFTVSELVGAIGIERFGARDAHLLLVALKGQGRVHHDHAGWYPGPPPIP
jgi:hypothetical protein